jgi:hypothetical protein
VTLRRSRSLRLIRQDPLLLPEPGLVLLQHPDPLVAVLLHLAGRPAELLREHLPRDELQEGVDGRMDHDPPADLLLEEERDLLDDEVDEGRGVDDVHLLHLDRVGLLDADEELLDSHRGDFGEVLEDGDAGVQHVDIPQDPHVFGLDPHVAYHEDELEEVVQVGGVEVDGEGAGHVDASEVWSEARHDSDAPAETQKYNVAKCSKEAEIPAGNQS